MNELDLAAWRGAVFELYAAVRNEESPATAHALWRARRDSLFREHPQSPLPAGDLLGDGGLPYWPYDPRLRFELPLIPARAPMRISAATGADGPTRLRLIGSIELPSPVRSIIGVWWLEQYGGGLFVPIRDGTAGGATYGGGRYLLDTAKGADLGRNGGRLIIDLNFPVVPLRQRLAVPAGPATEQRRSGHPRRRKAVRQRSTSARQPCPARPKTNRRCDGRARPAGARSQGARVVGPRRRRARYAIVSIATSKRSAP
jgi:hypothetical protein